jgi:hypothetical protein
MSGISQALHMAYRQHQKTRIVSGDGLLQRTLHFRDGSMLLKKGS